MAYDGTGSESTATQKTGPPQGAEMRQNSKVSVASRDSRLSMEPIVNQDLPFLSRIINSRWFESVIGLVILGNCITMGIEADLQLGKVQHMKGFLEASEHFFTGAFLLEFILRLAVVGWRSFMPHVSMFNFLDALLVWVTGVLATWIMPLLDMGSSGAMRTLTVLRSFRLVRLVRVVRKVELFHEVYVLLRGLTESVKTLVWTVVVIFFLTYVFAVFGVVLISSEIQTQLKEAEDPATRATLSEILSVMNGVFPMMYTLVQVLTQDSWNGIARPTQDYIPWSFLFFYCYLCVGVVVLMNLVTAIIVENALAHAKKDEDALLRNRQKERSEEFQKFKVLYEQMDIDGDGQLDRGEFEMAFDNPDVATKLRLLDFEPEDCRDIFELLDTGDGLLSLDEFFEGMMRMQGWAAAKDQFRSLKNVESLSLLLQQHNSEVMEELGELQRVAPGARKKHRKGNLRSRAMKTNRRQVIRNSKELPGLSGNGKGDESPLSPCSPTTTVSFGHFPSSDFTPPVPDAQKAADLMASVEQANSGMNLKIDSCNSAVAACNEKVDLVVTEVAALRSSIQQLVQMAAGSTQPRPASAPTGLRPSSGSFAPGPGSAGIPWLRCVDADVRRPEDRV